MLLAGALAMPATAQDPPDRKAPGVDKDAAVTIYRNGFASRAGYLEMRKHGAGECRRALNARGMRIVVGRGNDRCMYRPPVNGLNVDMAVTATLLRNTPGALRPRTGVAVVLRSGRGGDYRFEVFPNRLSWQLTKLVPAADGSEGERKVLAQGRDADAINGTGARNRLRLRAFGSRLAGWIGDKLVVRHTDAEVSLAGRTPAVAVVGQGAVASAAGLFDSITVRARDPRGNG